MSEKISNLEEEEQNKILSQIEGASNAMGMRAYEVYGSSPGQKKLKDLLGMCHNCDYLSYCETEFGNVIANCTTFKIRLSGQNRIKECNMHCPRNKMSLQEMYAIATLIDVRKNVDLGFTANVKNKGKK